MRKKTSAVNSEPRGCPKTKDKKMNGMNSCLCCSWYKYTVFPGLFFLVRKKRSQKPFQAQQNLQKPRQIAEIHRIFRNLKSNLLRQLFALRGNQSQLRTPIQRGLTAVKANCIRMQRKRPVHHPSALAAV